MSMDLVQRAAESFGVDVLTYRRAVDVSFERWAEMTGDTRPLSRLDEVRALGRVGCVLGLVLPDVIDEMSRPPIRVLVEPEPVINFKLLDDRDIDHTQRRLAEYKELAREYDKANPNSQYNPYQDTVDRILDGTLSFEN